LIGARESKIQQQVIQRSGASAAIGCDPSTSPAPHAATDASRQCLSTPSSTGGGRLHRLSQRQYISGFLSGRVQLTGNSLAAQSTSADRRYAVLPWPSCCDGRWRQRRTGSWRSNSGRGRSGCHCLAVCVASMIRIWCSGLILSAATHGNGKTSISTKQPTNDSKSLTGQPCSHRQTGRYNVRHAMNITGNTCHTSEIILLRLLLMRQTKLC